MSAQNQLSDAASPVPVGPFVRAQMLVRLREALHIATGDLSSQLEHFRDLLTEVAERADALNLVRTARADRASAQPSSHLAVAALSKTRGEPVREFLLIPFGEVAVERPIAGESFVFTTAHAESARRWFDQMGRKLAIDYEHQSFDRLNTRPDGLRPAAGWIGGLEIRDDGLWAVDVSWTDRARELLRSGEYRYFSPVIFWTDEDHTDVAALGPVALTNDPAMRGVSALAASRRDANAEAAGTTDDAHADPEAAAEPPPSGAEALLAARADLQAAETEISLLRQQLAAQEADTFVERGLRLGKVLESTHADWRADYLRDPAGTEERLARAPVLLPPGRMIALDRRGQAEGRPRSGIDPGRATTGGGPWGIEADDLAAYERAAGAGRVLHSGVVPAGRAARAL